MKIVGYSSFTNEQQYEDILAAYKLKSEVVRKAQYNNTYGSGLNTLLIFYNMETVPNEFTGTEFLKKGLEIQRYNSKEKSIRVNVFVGYDELTSKSYEDQVLFFFNTTMKSLEMVKEKFLKRKNPNVDIDFGKLLKDIEDGYLNEFTWLDSSSLTL